MPQLATNKNLQILTMITLPSQVLYNSLATVKYDEICSNRYLSYIYTCNKKIIITLTKEDYKGESEKPH